jgi:hypothetical protein
MSQKNFVPRNTALKDQLRNLLPGQDRHKPHHHKKGGRFNQPMSAPTGRDGVDHINIFEGATTDLGKCLSHSSQLRFNHELYGGFSNIESFWYYIRSVEHDDRVRKLTGAKLKAFADEMTPRRVKNFMAIILVANWQRVNQYPELKAAVKENTLPFECYSYLKRQDGIRQRPPHAHWMIPLFEEISLALKEDREPNLTNFLDDQKMGLYDDVFPKKETDDPELAGTIVEDVVETARKPALGALLNRPVAPEPEQVVSEAIVETPVEETVAEPPVVAPIADIVDTTALYESDSVAIEPIESVSAVDAVVAALDVAQSEEVAQENVVTQPSPVFATISGM